MSDQPSALVALVILAATFSAGALTAAGLIAVMIVSKCGL